jgi:ubiquinone/menaquinone biosynthesis C-methylase UbiE
LICIPRIYDRVMGPLEWLGLRHWRKKAIADAHGLVLEIGIGTGLNLTWYPKVGGLIGLDPDWGMLQKAAQRSEKHSTPLSLLCGSAENLPFQPATFDTAISTLVFCSVPDPVKGLGEIRRVLKPSGKFLMLEHVRARSETLGRLQDALTPPWARIARGCHLNRPTLELAQAAGFSIEHVKKTFNGAFLRAVLGRRS